VQDLLSLSCAWPHIVVVSMPSEFGCCTAWDKQHFSSPVVKIFRYPRNCLPAPMMRNSERHRILYVCIQMAALSSHHSPVLQPPAIAHTHTHDPYPVPPPDVCSFVRHTLQLGAETTNGTRGQAQPKVAGIQPVGLMRSQL
jgi:hypothetical protein